MKENNSDSGARDIDRRRLRSCRPTPPPELLPSERERGLREENKERKKEGEGMTEGQEVH